MFRVTSERDVYAYESIEVDPECIDAMEEEGWSVAMWALDFDTPIGAEVLADGKAIAPVGSKRCHACGHKL